MINKTYVPDSGPLGAKILFIGESPGSEEVHERKPFVGMSGQLLMERLARVGIFREEVRLANLCHYQPKGNDFKLLIDSKELAEGLAELKKYILTHKPQLIVPLGSFPLQYLTGKHGIHAYRGSILQDTISNTKCIPTFHPSAVLRDKSLLPIFDSDILRIKGDSQFADLRLPVREFVIDPRGLELEEYVQLLENSEEISVDIESTRKGDVGTKHILCIGFSAVPSVGICIPNHQDNATSNAYSRILASKAAKVFQFGTFDTTALDILNGYHTNNYSWDILTAQHILAPEMPRGLDFLASIYTREPYYKESGRAEIPGETKEWGSKVDKQSLYVYNCRDACVTMEVKLEQEKELSGRNLEMFHYEMSLIPIALSMGRNGLLVDMERREQFRKGLNIRWSKLQLMLNTLAGREVNVRSPKLKEILYGDFNLPVRRNRDSGITTDEDAIVSLIGYCVGYIDSLSRDSSIAEWKKKLLILKVILEIRGLRQLLSTYINAKVSNDNRLRSIYKYSNTETGRGACEKFIDGSGVNAQTFPRGSVDVPENLDGVILLDLGDTDDENESTDI